MQFLVITQMNYKKKYSNFVLKKSGERAVTETCLHIIKKFFYKKKIENLFFILSKWN